MSRASDNVSKELQKLAGALDKILEEIAGERVGFSLFVYTPDRANYVSSVNRECAAREMQKVLDLWKDGMPDVPAHKYQS